MQFSTRFLFSALAVFVLGTVMFASHPANAREAAGVKFEPTATVDKQTVKLNGVGVRTRAIFKVYAAGLYLGENVQSAPAAIGASGAKRMTLVMLRTVSSEDMSKAFTDGIRKNTPADEMAKFNTQLDALNGVFAAVPELKKGDTLHLDWVPSTGTVIELNGKQLAAPIAGQSFFGALLGIWLGADPADASLKSGLLSGN